MGASARKLWAGFFDPGDTLGSGALSLVVRDALGLGGVAGPVSYVDSVADGFILLESAANVVTLAPSAVSDALATGDSTSSRLSVTAAITESVTTGESVAGLLLLLDSVTDSLSSAESVSTRVTFASAVSDSFTSGDSQLTRLAALGSVSENLSSGESLSSRLAAYSTTLDGLVTGDALSSRLSMASVAFDGWSVLELTPFEFTPGAAGYVDSVLDGFGLGDALASRLSVTSTAAGPVVMGAGAVTVTSLVERFADGWALGEVHGTLVAYRETWADDFSLDSTASDVTSPIEPPTITIPSEVIERAMALADKLIKKYGRPIELIVYVDDVPPDLAKPWRVNGTTSIVQTVSGVFLKVEGSVKEDDQKKSQQVLVAAYGLTVAPNIKGEIRVDTDVWKVTKIQPVKPGGVDILYTLTVVQ